MCIVSVLLIVIWVGKSRACLVGRGQFCAELCQVAVGIIAVVDGFAVAAKGGGDANAAAHMRANATARVRERCYC